MANNPPRRKKQRGQAAAVLAAFEKHQLALKRFISRFLHNTQDIEDVAQEAFLRAYSVGKDADTDIK